MIEPDNSETEYSARFDGESFSKKLLMLSFSATVRQEQPGGWHYGMFSREDEGLNKIRRPELCWSGTVQFLTFADNLNQQFQRLLATWDVWMRSSSSGVIQMVFVVALAIGVAVSMTRSVGSIILSAALIGLTFVAAALLSQGGVSVLSLLLAIAGFNCAFAGQLAILLMLPERRAA